ncbi:hypothetical protein GCM10027093_65280 [Paraburkholderia jirisanensis]
MNGPEQQASFALQTLDEAHRLGRLTRDEYRLRRRQLLERLRNGYAAHLGSPQHGSGQDTQRDTVRRMAAAGTVAAPYGVPADASAARAAAGEPIARHGAVAAPAMPAARPGWRRVAWSVGALGVVCASAALYYWLMLRPV